jgi:hypothetical protein
MRMLIRRYVTLEDIDGMSTEECTGVAIKAYGGKKVLQMSFNEGYTNDVFFDFHYAFDVRMNNIWPDLVEHFPILLNRKSLFSLRCFLFEIRFSRGRTEDNNFVGSTYPNCEKYQS